MSLMTQPSAFVVEIGVEELPVNVVLSAKEQLEALVPAALRKARLPFAAIQIIATPRRLGWVVQALAARQTAEVQSILGPAKRVAFDEQGTPSPALLGFLKRYGATPKQVQITETPRGAYVALQQAAPMQTAPQVLTTLVPSLLAQLQFPKMMRWSPGGRSSRGRTTNDEPRPTIFPRPMRWLVALYGARVVPMRLGALTASPRTYANRAWGSSRLTVASARHYVALLRRARVLLTPDERRAALHRALEAALTPQERRQGVRLAPETLQPGHTGGISLLDEAANLVEWPTVFRGRVPHVTQLPREILIASMAKYQRVFALEDRRGGLLPVFLGVVNGRPRQLERVRHVYERILAARLADSLLFYQQDLIQPLEAAVPQLQSLMVHRQLGSLQEKVKRLQALSAWLAHAWQLSAEEPQIQRAVQLCKADLVTRVVYEFPSLQGVMGRIYHLHHAPHERVVAEAIEDAYLPQGRLPRSLIGAVVAIADRLDTLTGFFGIGIKPTGSADPFGLRRLANELVALLLGTKDRPLSLTAVLAHTLRGWGTQGRRRPEDVQTEVQAYVQERFATRQEARYDLVRAVLAAGFDDVGDAAMRLQALEACVRQSPRLLAQACTVAERTRNIVTAANIREALRVDPARFVEPVEREVWAAAQQASPRLQQAIAARHYGQVLTIYAETFTELLERFFTQVLVNADDAALRANRLALLHAIDQLIRPRVADLAQVVIPPPSP